MDTTQSHSPTPTSNSEPSGLWQHLNSCPSFKRKRDQLDVGQMLLTHKAETSMGSDVGMIGVTPKYCEKTITDLIVRMIIVDEMPFIMVQKHGFRNLINYLEPRFKMPSRLTIMRNCMKLYLKEKAKLKNVIQMNGYRLCFTADTWTSIQNFNYMCVTGHFIDENWTLQKRILSFRRVEDHKGITIANELEHCILHWGIKRILTITVDNASFNDAAIDRLRKRQLQDAAIEVSRRQWRGEALAVRRIVCGHEFLQLRCCAHILNLIVSEGLKDVDVSIAKVRDMIKYVKSSPESIKMFKYCAERRRISCTQFLSLDVPTRWNSTYLMLDVAEKYREAFDLMLEEDGHYIIYLGEGHERRELGPPTLDDWEHIRHFVKFLKLFYDVTIRMSGSNVSTTNVYFEELAKIHRHLAKYCSSSDILLKDMASRMKRKYDEYWGDLMIVNKLLFVATVLDPRYKLMLLEFWFKKVLGADKGHEMALVVKATLDRLFAEYSDGDNGSFEEMGDGDNVVLEGSKEDNEDWDEFDELRVAQALLNSKSEVERYLSEVLEANAPTFEILLWWKLNSPKYPVLARIARNVLAIPITSMPFESVFNTEGQILDPFRSSLAPKTAEGLICVQNWLRCNPIVEEEDMTSDMTEDPQTYTLDKELPILEREIEKE